MESVHTCCDVVLLGVVVMLLFVVSCLMLDLTLWLVERRTNDARPNNLTAPAQTLERCDDTGVPPPSFNVLIPLWVVR